MSEKEQTPNPYDAFIKGAASEHLTSNTFSELISWANGANIHSKDDLYTAMYPYEVQLMENFFSNDPTAKWDKPTKLHNKGDWKFSKLREKYAAWPTTKSIIGNALDFVVPLVDDDGEPRKQKAITDDLKRVKTATKKPQEKDEGELRKLLDKVLLYKNESSTYDEVIRKWFSDNF